jgi:hypothetical protein
MSEDATDDDFIKIDQMSIDQAAGAFVMIAGAIGSLLLVIWQSKCHCKMNLCYIFQCERRPPNEEEMKGLKEQSEKLKNINKKEDKILDKEDEILDEVESQKGTPRLIPEISVEEPEPQQQSKS